MNKMINSEDIKKIGLEGLSYIDDFCKHHGITYCLAYGSLLGAIRHKGFIPWDDDIDLFMPRNDYEKFISLKSQFDNEKWEVLSHTTNEKYLFPWMKVCDKRTTITPSRFYSGMLYGVSIDILPLDDCESLSDQEAENEMESLALEYKTIIKKKFYYTGGLEGKKKKVRYLIKKCLFHLNKFFNSSSDAIQHLEEKVSKKKTKSLYLQCPLCPLPRKWLKEDFSDYITVPFEHLSVPVPKGYDRILKTMYGDYMIPPPENKRVTHHSFIGYFN